MKGIDEIVQIMSDLAEDSCEKCPIENCMACGEKTDEICKRNLKKWLQSEVKEVEE